MPQRRQGGRQQEAQRAVVASGPPDQTGPQRALQLVNQEIDNRLAIIGASAAAGIKAERLKLVALTTFTRTPALWTVDPVSVARSLVEAGQLGLEPTGLLGGAYLVPRGGQATLLVGYRGLVMLAKRSGEVQRVEAHVVREKDAFDYEYGLDQYLHHKPSREADPGPLTHAYAVIFYRDGSKQFDVMSAAEIEEIRKRSASPNAGPWVTDYFEMAKKTPLRRLMKMAPLTIEVAEVLDRIDPEVVEEPKATDPREAELRAQLQRELEREYGAAGPVSEGEFREAPTTNGGGPGTAAAQAPGAEAGAAPPASPPAAAQPAQDTPQPAPAAHAGSAAVPAAEPAPSQPEAVGQILGERSRCGVEWAEMQTGPCVLEPGHTPPNEHENAGGTRWSQPRGGK
jgi:recombination protein RecT